MQSNRSRSYGCVTEFMQGDIAMRKVLIVADDLTGALDSAVQFATRDVKPAVTIAGGRGERIETDSPVRVIDTESRDVSADEAAARVADALDLVQCDTATLAYKKIDSTLRGKLGAEIATVSRRLHRPLILIAPAYIEAGRTTVEGCQYLKGVPLEKTELASIPKSPITTSRISDIIKNELPHSHSVSVSETEKGKAALKSHLDSLIAKGGNVFIFDATAKEHLATLAETALCYPDALMVGSAGFALALQNALHETETADAAPTQQVPGRKAVRRVLCLSGSVSAVSRGQCQALIEKAEPALYALDPVRMLKEPETLLEELTKRLQRPDRSVTLVTSALCEEDVQASRKVGESLGLTFPEVGERVATFMGALMAAVAPHFEAFIMTGGDTAVHACLKAGADSFYVLEELTEGIPLSVMASGPLTGGTLITKAGAFGNRDAFVQAVHHLLSPKEQN